MNKQQIMDEIRLATPEDRKAIFGFTATLVSAETVQELVDKYKPKWSQTALGKAAIGIGIAILATVGAKFYYGAEVNVTIPETAAEEAPAEIENAQ